jgi:hypothetical protein
MHGSRGLFGDFFYLAALAERERKVGLAVAWSLFSALFDQLVGHCRER